MRHVTVGGAAAGTLLIALTLAPHLGAASAGKIPITTSSEEAKQLYLKGRDLAEKLRATDARKLYEQAAQKDPTFAMAYVGLANTSGTTKEFIEATTKAVSLAGNASEGERHIVQALEAGMIAPKISIVQPYGLIGLGLIRTDVENKILNVSEAQNQFGWNIGGGVIIYLQRHVGLKGDIRYYHSVGSLNVLGFDVLGGDKIDFGRVGLGMVFKF